MGLGFGVHYHVCTYRATAGGIASYGSLYSAGCRRYEVTEDHALKLLALVPSVLFRAFCTALLRLYAFRSYNLGLKPLKCQV